MFKILEKLTAKNKKQDDIRMPSHLSAAEQKQVQTVETDYTKLEDKLRKKIDRIETDHPGYDEYRYNLAEIGHNPYELASLLTVEFENYTRSQVQARLQSIFEAQYELKLVEKVEIRTRK